MAKKKLHLAPTLRPNLLAAFDAEAQQNSEPDALDLLLMSSPYLISGVFDGRRQAYIEIPDSKLESIIHQIRGQDVILDVDLAELYGCKREFINILVSQRIKRFPGDFRLELSAQELEALKSKNIALNYPLESNWAPTAFNEQGVAMLSTVIGNEAAIQINIKIMQKLKHLRRDRLKIQELKRKVENLETKYDAQLHTLSTILKELLAIEVDKRSKSRIGFNPDS